MQPVSLDEGGDCAGSGDGLARPRRLARPDSDERKTSRGRMNFSAVILAGGKSSRMGRDKAWLEVGRQTLLARQIQLAQAAGATEIFVSGRFGVAYPTFRSEEHTSELQ